MHDDSVIPPQVCPRCERENLPLATNCSCGQELHGAPVMPAQGIPAGLGKSPVSNQPPGVGMQPRSSAPLPAASPTVVDLTRTRRRRPRVLLTAAVLGIGAVVVLVPVVFFGFLGSAQADPAGSSSPSSQAASSSEPGISASPGTGSSPANGSPSPPAGASTPVTDVLGTALLDAGGWSITHTVTASTLDSVQVGDRRRSTWDVTYSCATPPCDAKVSMQDRDSVAAAAVATFTYSDGTYTAIEPSESARCLLGDRAVLPDAYHVRITTTLHATASKPQGGHSVATHLDGSQLREGVPTADGASEGCKPWRVELATSGEPGKPSRAAMSRSVNWSGYHVQRKGGARITAVEGTWVQPSVSCQSAHRQMASFWIGIDGVHSKTLEQIGTSSECANARQDLYYAWWEMIPAPMVRIPILIRPGDTIHAEITVTGGTFKLSITNVTLDDAFSIVQTDATARQATAEWVAEATSMCGRSACEVSALPDFDSVRFTGCSATVDGETALLGDPSWTPTLDVMVAVGHQNTLKALPSAVDAASDGFTVDWLSVGP